jgi:hypothetical protein
MKLSVKTINILKNYSTINKSIIFDKGGVIKTMSPTKTILSRAVITEDFPVSCAIYNLNKFINSLSLVDNAELDFGDHSVRIFNDSHSISYHYSDEAAIEKAPEKDIILNNIAIECLLTNKHLQTIMRSLGVLELSNIAIVGDGNNIMIQSFDPKAKTNDTYSIVIGDTNKEFRAVFRSENLKMMDGDYSVSVSSKGIARFDGLDISYWVAIETTSVF